MKSNPEAFKKIDAVKRATVKMSPQQLVTTTTLFPDKLLPLIVTPAIQQFDPISFGESYRPWIQTQLLKHGGLLFRNFNITNAEVLDQLVRAICGTTLEYRERSSPRSQVAGNIYTSTDYPADQVIFLHNENSYQHTFPLKIFFNCICPAEQGGETPIADMRKVYRRIDPKIRQQFADRQVMYVRNFQEGLGLSWTTVFQTTNKTEVEAYCHKAGIQFEWRDQNRLRIRQVRPAVVTHPRTGEVVWFNHATFFHVSTLPPVVRKQLLVGCAEEDLPNNSYYGDGSPIEPSVMDELRACYQQETVMFPWNKGDVLMLDNMLVAHGRSSFKGSRKVLVAMAEPHSLAGNASTSQA